MCLNIIFIAWYTVYIMINIVVLFRVGFKMDFGEQVTSLQPRHNIVYTCVLSCVGAYPRYHYERGGVLGYTVNLNMSILFLANQISKMI